MNTKLLSIIATCCISFGYCHTEERTNRAFSLFNVVKFKNTNCQAVSSSDLQGVCYTSQECSDLGGTADGNCAASFGVCCVITVSTCGGTVSQNCSFIENVGFPSGRTLTGACAYTITRCSSEICQIRLDYTNFNIAQPTDATTGGAGGAAGACGGATGDQLIIEPGATPTTNVKITPPTICGNNAGQHMYVDAGTANTAATLTFTTNTAGTGTWRVKVSQIECSSRERAPANCLQYFRSAMAVVTTFNWNGGAGDCTTGCFTQSQDYNSCFRKERGMCAIQYTPTQVTSGDAFNLGNNNGAGTFASTGVANCMNAFVQIQDVSPETLLPTNAATVTQVGEIFCGTQLSIVDDAIDAAGANSGVILSLANQFKLRVFANPIAANIAQVSLAGFSLDATQVPC